MSTSTALRQGSDNGFRLYVLLVAALPLLGYQFCVGNQVEQFSLIAHFNDPSLLTRDFYVASAAQFGPRYYYVWTLSLLTRLLPLSAVILILTYLTNLALAEVSRDAVQRHLRGGALAGGAAALFVVTNGSFAFGFAGYLRFDSYQPASLAIPLALLGLSLLVRDNQAHKLMAGAAFAGSAIMHPLIGVETAIIGYAAVGLAQLIRHRSFGGAMRASARYIPSGIIFAAVVIPAWVVPSLGAQVQRIPDQEFFEILAVFRAPHHYLARAIPLTHRETAALFCATTTWLAYRYVRRRGMELPSVALAMVAAVTLSLCAASVFFVDILHSRMWTTAQMFRTLMLIKWVGYLVLAWSAERWMLRGDPLSWICVMALALGTGEAQPRVMALCVAAMTFANRVNLARRVRIMLAVPVVLLSIAWSRRYGAHEETVRAAVGLACGMALYLWQTKPAFARAAAIGVVAASLAFGIVNRQRHFIDLDAFLPAYSFDDIAAEPDVDVAHWARANTPREAVWLTPPRFERFRLLAERAIVADFTSIPFDDMSLRSWKERMTGLYGAVPHGGFRAVALMDDNYRHATGDTLRQAGRRFGASYAVLYADTPWPGAVLYQNPRYKIVTLEP